MQVQAEEFSPGAAGYLRSGNDMPSSTRNSYLKLWLLLAAIAVVAVVIIAVAMSGGGGGGGGGY